MYRKILSSLIKWKENHSKMALLLSGARQTGKTYILKEFCEKHFEQSLYINFDEESKFVSIFEDSLNPEEIIKKIEILCSRKLDIENTIFFFDEIQVSERAITSLKYFSESKKNYKIVCAGSLLGVKLNRFKASFPVGSVYFENMYPMDFEEFLLAAGEEELNNEINKSFNTLKELNDALHRKALSYYKAYLCVGGMPRAILEYLKAGKDFAVFDRNIHSSILLAYLADMAKYSTGTNAVKLNHVYQSMPAQLAKEKKKFTYKLVGNKAKKETYESAIEWLLLSGLLLKSSRVEMAQAPLSAYQNNNIFKLYMSDIGLLCNLAKLQFGDILLDSNIMYKGILTENFIAQTFKCKGYELYYWESKGLAEMDFLLNLDGHIIPVEVKASENTSSKSLFSYVGRYKPDYSIRISTKNFGYVNGIKSIPLYSAHNI
ncbi:MAG: AAA family ATPase [Candidatus Firestonebacteria bacterium]